MSNAFDENKRRIIDLLAVDEGYSINSRILWSVLTDWGHSIPLDDVHKQLKWLEHVGCVRTEWIGDFAQVATLTQRGLDASEGRIQIRGIERKLPELE